MKLTPQTYQKMAEQASPPTKSRITIPSAFLIGGGICTLGEVFLNLFTRMGAEKEAASAWASICLIFLSALFTGLGLYEKLAKFGRIISSPKFSSLFLNFDLVPNLFN